MPGLEFILTTLRQSFRSLLRHRGYSALVISLMALTIGANVATFSALSNVVLKALPYRDPDRLASPQLRDTKRNALVGASMPEVLDFVRLNHSFEYLGSYYTKAVTITGMGAAEDQAMMIGSPDILKVLGAPIFRGRYFTHADDVRGARAAIISYSLWARRFNSDPAVVGKPIVLNGVPYEIVGVAGRGFDFGYQFLSNRRPIEVWATHAIDREPALGSPHPVVELREARYLNMIGRLKRGATPISAAHDFATIVKELSKQYPDSFQNKVVEVNSELERIVGTVRPILTLLFGGTGLLLLIGCTNAANLTLSRMLARRQEIWLKKSLGADALRLMGQLLAEGMILSLIAGGLGVILAVWSLQLLKIRLDRMLPRALEGGLDWQVAFFAGAVSIFAGLLFTVVPAWLACSAASDERGAGRGQSDSRQTQWGRRSLVIAQVAVSMVLLVSTGLLVKNLSRLLSIDLGFRTDGIAQFVTTVSPVRYKLPAQAAFFRRLSEQLAAVPGTEAVAAITPPPLGRLYVGAAFQVENGAGDPRNKPFCEWHVATPGYFRILGIQQILGRDFDGTETLDSKPVAVINETLARQWFPGRNPVGRQIRLKLGNDPPFREILGVVADARQKNLKAPFQPAIYLPHAQFPFNSMTFYVKRAGDPLAILEPARLILAGLDKDVLLKEPARLADVVADATAVQRVSTMLLSVISAIALLLCAGGLYGVVAYTTAKRRQEIAIRLALGASPINIHRRFVADAALACAAGLTAGAVTVFALRGLLAKVLDDAKAPDSATLAGAAAILMAVTLVASYLPSRRAANLDVARNLQRD